MGEDWILCGHCGDRALRTPDDIWVDWRNWFGWLASIVKIPVWIWLISGIALLVLYGWWDPAVYSFPDCPFRTLTGLLCPGCGSQRAIHQTLHGHFLQAMQLNALFLPGIFYGIVGFIVSKFFPKAWPSVRTRFYGLNAAYVSFVVIIAFWIGRNLV